MTSEAIRDPLEDHLLTPQSSAFIIIDYQPIQVGSIRSMDQRELVFNIVHTAKAVVNSTVNVVTDRNKPPIQPLMDVLVHTRSTTVPRSTAGRMSSSRGRSWQPAARS